MASNESSANLAGYFGNVSLSSTVVTATTLSETELKKKEFYQTYEPMTGVRIAATLGGFFVFVLVVLLYKSKCKTTKHYGDSGQPSQERIEAIEEAAELLQQQTIPYTVLPSLLYDRGFSFDGGVAPPIPQPSLRKPRYSVISLTPSMLRVPQNSPPVRVLPRNLRSHTPSISSAGLEPAQLLALHHKRRTSVDCHSLRRNSRDLRLPHTSRRSSLRLDLPGQSWERVEATKEWLQHIDINVIQPTPNISPCPSMRVLTNDSYKGQALLTPRSSTKRRNSATPRLSVCSDVTDADLPSLGSDSVFIEEDLPPECPTQHRRASQTVFNYPTPKPSKRQCIKPAAVVSSSFLTMPMSLSLSRSCERLANAASGEEGEIYLNIAFSNANNNGDCNNSSQSQETPL